MGHFEKGRWVSDMAAMDSSRIIEINPEIEEIKSRLGNLEQSFVNFVNHYRATSWMR